jgi:hypothetical protein
MPLPSFSLSLSLSLAESDGEMLLREAVQILGCTPLCLVTSYGTI